MPLLYTIGQHTVGPAIRLSWRPEIEGLERIPAAGGAILAGNHLSVADELFLGAVVPRHVSFLAKAEYFRLPGVKGRAIAGLMNGLGVIALPREGGRASLLALDTAVPVLQAGELVAIYPEGTRSTDGKLHRGRTGVAKLALSAGVPVIPVGMTGTDRVQPIGTTLPRLGPKVSVRFGKPMEFTGRPADRAGLRAITDEIMVEIQKLTGQEYTGRYAPRRSGG